VQVTAAEEPVLLGTVIAARLGLGESLNEVARDMVPGLRLVEPDAVQ
jgi:hypothetical protein